MEKRKEYQLMSRSELYSELDRLENLLNNLDAY